MTRQDVALTTLVMGFLLTLAWLILELVVK
jgi:hypothetical protein